MPVVPQGDYELEVKFTKTAGTGGIVLYLPVPDSSKAGCNLLLGNWRNTVAGIENDQRQTCQRE